MRRHTSLTLGAVAMTVILLSASSGFGMLPARMTVPACVASADCIVIGKITSIEEKSVTAPAFPGSTVKSEFRVAVVKIDENLLGGKGLTHVRIAFPPPPPPAPKIVQPPKGPIAIRTGGTIPVMPYDVNTEGCFILRNMGDEGFFRPVDRSYNDYLPKTDREFDSKLALVKRSTKFREDPDAGLKSKESADRLLTAYLLITSYNANAGPKSKSEPVEAARSKQILEAIANADWTKVNTPGDPVTPVGVFNQLRLTPKDGWNAPKQAANQDFRDFTKQWQTASQKWLKDNADTYRIQRWRSAP